MAEETALTSGLVVEDTGLSTKTEQSAELAQAQVEATAIAEIQAAMAVAQRFARNENEGFQKVVRSLQRPTFAEQAEYVYTRAGTVVKGPSIYLATEFARAWGNIRVGLDVVRADGHTTTIRGWAWDMESNAFWSEQDHFRNMVQRRDGWRAADERELREVKNRRGSICMRNCILKLLPKDLVDEACDLARKQKTKDASADPDKVKRDLLGAFASLTPPVKAEQLEEYLGRALDSLNAEDLVDLRAIYTSLKEGYTRWADDFAPESADAEEETPGESPVTKAAKKAKAKRKPKAEAAPTDKPAPEGEAAPPSSGKLIDKAGQERIMSMIEGKPSGLLKKVLKKYGAESLDELAGGFELAVISDLQKG